MIAATTIVNANINGSAAIALSKLDRTEDASWTGAQRGTLQVVTDGTLDLNFSHFTRCCCTQHSIGC